MKTVAVVSGKGGTGKTTLTAVLAHLASEAHRVALADADVEASNLPLALRVQHEECVEFRGGAKASIAPYRCLACGLCSEVCRFEAILHPEGGSFAVDPIACEGCGYCALVCPTEAVTMVQTSIGKACRGQSAIGAMAHGQLDPGQDLSGRLVTEVRRLGVEAAQEHGAEILLVDGPPGTGCPLIAAITNVDLLLAVTEPTLSGVHDLVRLVGLADRFGTPVGVVLNKADLSERGAEEVRQACASSGLPLWAEIPFAPDFAEALQSMAEGDSLAALRASPTWCLASRLWDRLELELGLREQVALGPSPGVVP